MMPFTMTFAVCLLTTLLLHYSDAEVQDPSACWLEDNMEFLKAVSKMISDFKSLNLQVKRLELCPGIPCDHGWVSWGSTCYYFLEEKKTFNEANIYCNSKGAILTVPEKKTANDFLKSKMPRDKVSTFWLGNIGWAFEKQGRYSDGDCRQRYLDNVSSAMCVAMEKAGWVVESCDNKYGAICEKKYK